MTLLDIIKIIKLKKEHIQILISTKEKEKKINLKKVGKKLMNLCIKTKDEYHLDERKTHRSPEELHFYIRNKKIMRKKNEVKKLIKNIEIYLLNLKIYIL